MSVEHAERLALQAALLPRSEAEAAWRRLLGAVPWMDFPDPVIRCLPAVAVNLHCHSRSASRESSEETSGLPHSAQLAGVYRATWTANVMRVRGIAPVLASFDARDFRYRVLKGAAICALTDRWGVRRMGDIDVVIHSADAPAAVALLRAMGFAPRFFRVIDDSAPPPASCWVGPQEQILDVHIGDPSRRRPEVMDLMLGGPGARARSQGQAWALPTPEAMVVNAVAHARMGAAASDRAQALLDLSRLLPLAEPEKLIRLAHRARVSSSLEALKGELAEITGVDEHATSTSRLRTAGSAFGRVSDRILGDVRRLPAVLSERSTTGSGTPMVVHGRVRPRLYRAWLATGQLRPVERAVCVTLGGFVREGSIDLACDRRVRVDVPKALRGRTVSVSVDCPGDHARLLFIDGRSHGVVDGHATARVEDAPRSLEISMRLLGNPPDADLSPITVQMTGLSGDGRGQEEGPTWI